MRLQLRYFVFLPLFSAFDADSTITLPDSTWQLFARINHVEQKINQYDQDRTEILLREAQNNIEIASKIIDWTAMILTGLAIGIAFMGFLGWQSIRDVRRQRESMQKELDDIKRLREQSSEQITLLKEQIEKESKSLMDFLYYSNAGDIRYQRVEIDSAINYYKQALQLKADSAEVRLKLGRAYLREAKYDDAIREFTQSIEFAPDSAKHEHYVQLGRAYRRKGAIENAKRYYEKALELSPSSTSAMNGLGRVYIELGEHEKAVEWLRRSCVQKNYPVRVLNLGIAHALANMPTESKRTLKDALEISQRILRINPLDREALYVKAIAFAGLEDENNATLALENAIQVDQSKGTMDSMKERLKLLARQLNPPVFVEKLLRMLES